VAQTDKHNEGSKEIARRTRGASIAGGSLRESLAKINMHTLHRGMRQ